MKQNLAIEITITVELPHGIRTKFGNPSRPMLERNKKQIYHRIKTYKIIIMKITLVIKKSDYDKHLTHLVRTSTYLPKSETSFVYAISQRTWI
jgi:hypothetical protein